MFVVVIGITRAVGSKGINLSGFYLTLSSLSAEQVVDIPLEVWNCQLPAHFDKVVQAPSILSCREFNIVSHLVKLIIEPSKTSRCNNLSSLLIPKGTSVVAEWSSFKSMVQFTMGSFFTVLQALQTIALINIPTTEEEILCTGFSIMAETRMLYH